MSEYTILGGDYGKSRLDVLSDAIENQTQSFLDSCDLKNDSVGIDLGCGNGRVSILLAKTLSKGHVLGIDTDQSCITEASVRADKLGLSNLDFTCLDAHDFKEIGKYDFVYSRFLLSHLSQPKAVLKRIWESLKVGGKVILEDTDFSGHFSYPDSDAFNSYVFLYKNLLAKRGADSCLGKRLHQLLSECGFSDIELHVHQPVHISEDGKRMAELTLEAVADALVEEGLISRADLDSTLDKLIAFRKGKDSIMSMPRIFQLVATKSK